MNTGTLTEISGKLKILGESKLYIFMVILLILSIIIRLKPFSIFFIFPVIILFYIAFTVLSTIYSIHLFSERNKWVSLRKISAFIFLVPLVLFLYPFIEKQIQPYYEVPNDKLVKSYIHEKYYYATGAYNALDVNSLNVRYDRSTKNLNFSIKLNPENLLTGLERYNLSTRTFMDMLYTNYYLIPCNLSDFSKVPKYLTVKGYWGDTLLFTAHFQKSNNHYQLLSPYPKVKLISSNNNWYIDYVDDKGNGSTLLVEEFAKSDEYQIDLFSNE